MASDLNSLLTGFLELTQQPDSFLRLQESKSSSFRTLTKSTYDLSKSESKQLSPNVGPLLAVRESLPQLHVQGFDEEQIWQQLELENNPFLGKLVRVVSKLTAKKEKLTCRVIEEKEKKKPVEPSKFKLLTTLIERVIDSSDEDDGDHDEDEEEEEKHVAKKVKFNLPDLDPSPKKAFQRQKGSIVDDKFFKLAQLEKFLNDEDNKEEKLISGKNESDDEDEEDDIDYFELMSSDQSDDDSIKEIPVEDKDNAREANYNDFFDPPEDEFAETEGRTRVGGKGEGEGDNEVEDEEEVADLDEELDTRDVDDVEEDEPADGLKNDRHIFGMDSSEEDSEGEMVEDVLGKTVDRKEQSQFEKEQELIKKQINKMETQSLLEKPWQLKGEITAERRPENSLLEEHFQFDHVSRQAPLMTEETTHKLEDIILQRIKDASFDDVQRKIKPVEQAFEYRRRIALDQEKNKVSLAEVYEKEYLKKQEMDAVEEEKPGQKEIKAMMRTLFLQLDALSSFHFTPRPPEPEVKMINNLPAITVEEVTPAAVSDAALLAPQEILEKSRGDVKSKTERSQTDKKHERRLKKKGQGLKRKHMEAKEKLKQAQPGLGNKYSKIEKSKQMKEAKKSKLSVNEEDNAKERTNHVKSSKSFFAKLQDQVKDVMGAKKKAQEKEKKQFTSRSLKL